MRPMLATRGEKVPTGADWVHEVKWDGMRALAQVDAAGTARLWSRNENDVTVSFPELSRLPAAEVLLDGEVVAMAQGRPSFGALAERMHQRNARRAAALAGTRPVTYLVFDLLRLGHRDLTREPLSARRALLEGLELGSPVCQVPGWFDDGAMLMEATRVQELEGVVSKRLTSAYQPGTRSRHWLKFPHRGRASWVVGGWRPETGSKERLGAVLVGEPAPGGSKSVVGDGLIYRGRVGSGIAGRAGAVLLELLEPLAQATSPFVDEVPPADAAGTRWVRPLLVVEVESLGFSHHDRLRQPAYRGVRIDAGPDTLIGQPTVGES